MLATNVQGVMLLFCRDLKLGRFLSGQTRKGPGIGTCKTQDFSRCDSMWTCGTSFGEPSYYDQTVWTRQVTTKSSRSRFNPKDLRGLVITRVIQCNQRLEAMILCKQACISHSTPQIDSKDFCLGGIPNSVQDPLSVPFSDV